MNDLTYWQAALAGEKPEIHEGNPQCGYYRLRKGRGGTWLPVAIWVKDGEMVARVGEEMRPPAEIWTWCADKPVDKEDCKFAFREGHWPGDVQWDDEPGIGDNNPPQTVVEKITAACSQALDWLKGRTIADKVSADMAANLRDKILKLKKDAEAEHKAAKAPHLERCREVDAAYKAPISDASDAIDALRGALTVYMRAEEDRQRKEAAERARIANAEAEKKAKEEAATRIAREEKARRDGKPLPEAAPAEDPGPLFVAPEPVKVQVGGQRGARTGLKTVKRAVIKDYAATLAFFAEHAKVKDLIQQLAQHAARDGHPVPGVETIEERVAA